MTLRRPAVDGDVEEERWVLEDECAVLPVLEVAIEVGIDPGACVPIGARVPEVWAPLGERVWRNVLHLHPGDAVIPHRDVNALRRVVDVHAEGEAEEVLPRTQAGVATERRLGERDDLRSGLHSRLSDVSDVLQVVHPQLGVVLRREERQQVGRLVSRSAEGDEINVAAPATAVLLRVRAHDRRVVDPEGEVGLRRSRHVRLHHPEAVSSAGDV